MGRCSVYKGQILTEVVRDEIKVDMVRYKALTVLASPTMSSHIRSEWKEKSSEANTIEHACSSCSGL